MNREIKFRAWDFKQIRYDVTGFEHGFKNEMAGIFLNGDYHTLKEEKNDIHPLAIAMQFTGLHDKNGKEIYEGDIVRCDDGSLQEVYFNKCAFVCKSLGTEQTDDDWMIENDDEVIGNIYETK